MANSRCSSALIFIGIFFIGVSQASHKPKHPQIGYEAPDVGWSWYKDTRAADVSLREKPSSKESVSGALQEEAGELYKKIQGEKS